MGSKPKTPQVPAVDIAGDIQKYVSGLQGQLPTILASEAQYRPQFQGLNLADIQSFLGGTEQQQGLFGLSALASQQTQEQLQQARAAELAGMQAQAPAVRALMQTLSPEAAQQVANAQVIAQQAQRRAEQRQLSPQEARMATQTAREASGQRGMLGSIGSVASEVLNRDMYREQVQQAARQEASQLGTQAYNLGQQFYTAPGLGALSSSPLSYQTGQQQLGLALGAIGAGTPQLYDIGSALNIGAAQRQNQVAAQAAGAQAKAVYSSGLFGGIGSAIGGIGGAIVGGPFGAALGASLGGTAGSRI